MERAARIHGRRAHLPRLAGCIYSRWLHDQVQLRLLVPCHTYTTLHLGMVTALWLKIVVVICAKLDCWQKNRVEDGCPWWNDCVSCTVHWLLPRVDGPHLGSLAVVEEARVTSKRTQPLPTSGVSRLQPRPEAKSNVILTFDAEIFR